MTLHSPSNVDEGKKLKQMFAEIVKNAIGLPIIFLIHLRTAKIFTYIGNVYLNLHTIEPLGYSQFNYLVQHANAVITDSGGITEETTEMNIPCITLRDSTERLETVSVGTNELLYANPNAIAPAFEKSWTGNWEKGEFLNYGMG
jgi:UDP-N-acetylglucosamine 2-epimerase (non-hydrolysing)